MLSFVINDNVTTTVVMVLKQIDKAHGPLVICIYTNLPNVDSQPNEMF